MKEKETRQEGQNKKGAVDFKEEEEAGNKDKLTAKSK